jgi:hypothetical protein
MNKSIVFLIIFVLICSVIPFTAFAGADGSADPETNSRDSSRKSTEHVTTFSDGSKDDLLMFGAGGGTNQNLNVSLPKRSTVLSAEMEIEGRATPLKSVYNYSDAENNTAWYGNASALPTNEHPSEFEDIEFDNKEYGAIVHNDTTRAEHSTATFKATKLRLYHMFRFNITDSDAVSFTFYWSGMSYRINSIGFKMDELYAYIYSPGNNTWVKFFYFSGSQQWGKYVTVREDIQQAGNYMNSTTASVHFLLVGPYCDTSIWDTGTLGTDSTNLTVYSGSSQYPTDVKLDVGGDADFEWTHVGQFTTKTVIPSSSST